MLPQSDIEVFTNELAKETRSFLKPLTRKISDLLLTHGHKTACEYIDTIVNTLQAMKKTIEHNVT